MQTATIGRYSIHKLLQAGKDAGTLNPDTERMKRFFLHFSATVEKPEGHYQEYPTLFMVVSNPFWSSRQSPLTTSSVFHLCPPCWSLRRGRKKEQIPVLHR